jgi:tetratricopeptide (TPR) repeat protein
MGTVKTLHIQLERDESNHVTITSFTDDRYDRKTRSCPLGEIAKLLQDAERDYYTSLPAEKTEIGKKLYNWLDGDERWFSTLLKPSKRNHTILAIETGDQNGELAHLPWELLHDDKGFLVERNVVPVRWLSEVEAELKEPEARSLRVLFMASSPIGVEPVLKFELEEQTILETAENQPLSLIVEESGSLTGLKRVSQSYREGHFDILHLSGHATLTENGARFLTETETGALKLVSAGDVIKAVENRVPQLIFLSGCHTGRASGATPSMAEALLNEGGVAVLGWGRAVFDDSAIAASAVLYSQLSAGYKLVEAIASTYQHLIEKVDDWHLLRLYVPGEDTVAVPGAFVTSDAADRDPPIYKATTEKFAGKQIVSPQAFVGRRREIQACLRSLRDTREGSLTTSYAGSLIYGLGGIGKTALAARLCDSLAPQYQCLVVTGKIDEVKLVEALRSSVEEDPSLYDFLKSKQSLSLRLKKVFAALQKSRTLKLIVLDEFEANLEARDGKFVLSATARGVLEALVAAIRNPDAGMPIQHRLIITSRYKFSFEHLYEQPLGALQSADLTKKCGPNFYKFSSALRSQVLHFSDGNPELLQVLVEKLTTSLQPEEELDRLKTNPSELFKLVIGEKTNTQIDQLDANLRQLLATGLLFTLPVPRSVFFELCSSDLGIDRAIALGLLEVNFQGELRVPRLLSIDPIENPETSTQAAKILHQVWNLNVNKTASEKEAEVRMLEIYRLAQQGTVNSCSGAIALISEITQQLVNIWQHRSRFREAIKLCESTLDMTQDYQILHQLAQCETQINRFEQAENHYQQALALCPLEDQEKKAFLLYELATLKVNQNQLEAAKPLFEQAEQLQEQLQNSTLKTAILSSWAAVYDREGNVQKAIEVCTQALDLQKEATDSGLGEIFQRLGEIALRGGGFEAAEANLRKSLELKGIAGDVRGKSMALFELGRLYQAQAQFEKAIEFYSHCLELQEWLENYPVQAAIWYQLATIYQHQQQFKTAIECCERALKIYTQFDDSPGRAAITKLLEDV